MHVTIYTSTDCPDQYLWSVNPPRAIDGWTLAKRVHVSELAAGEPHERVIAAHASAGKVRGVALAEDGGEDSVPLPVTDEDLYWVMTTAVEQGIAYWARGRNFRRDGGLYTSFEVCDREDEPKDREWHTVNATKCREAVGKIIAGKVKINDGLRNQIMSDLPSCDADAADCIVQIACFGEIVYG